MKLDQLTAAGGGLDATVSRFVGLSPNSILTNLVSRPMRLHDCRHWHATQLVAVGVDLNTVADRLGHETAAFTLAVYGHSNEERDRAAADAIGAVLG